MDYLLAAHIQVTGGSEAALQLQQVQIQINNFATAARNAGTGTMAADMDKAASSGGAFSAVMDRVTSSLIRMATYQGIQLVEQAIRSAVGGILDFDQAMTESLAIQQGVTGQMRSSMEDMAESIAVKFGEMPGDVAQGFYYLASAGLTVEQQLATLPGVAAFAKAGMMDLSSATEMLFDALSAIGQKSDDPLVLAHNLTNLSDVLTEAAIKSQATVEQMGSALANKAGASIKAFNLDLNESVGVLEVFANQGIKGSVAGERFSMLIRDMALKSQKFGEEWAAMGVQVFDSEGHFNSLVTIFQQLDAALLPMSGEERINALKGMGFTLRDISTVMSVLGTSGSLAAFTADLEHAGGVAQRVAETQMESLRSKLDQLKAVTLVFAIDGFGKLEEAAAWLVSTFSPAVTAVIDVLEQLAKGAAPVGAVLGTMVATGVVVGLQGIALAVQTVFDVIGSHPGVVEALGAALAGIAAAQIVGAIAGIAVSLGETLYLKALMAQDAINGLLIKMMTLAQTEGVMAAMRAGFSSLVTLLTSPIAAGVGIAVLLYEAKRLYDEGAERAEHFKSVVETRYDMSSVEGINHALDEMKQHVDEVNERVKDKGIFASWADVGEVRQAEQNLKDMNRELANAHIGVTLIAAAFTDGAVPLGQWAEELDRAGINIKDLPIAEMRQKIEELAGSTKVAGASTQEVASILQQLAVQSNIDIKQPMEKWIPQLTEIYGRFVEVRAITGDMGGIAEGSATKMSTMEQAMVTLGDEAATAEDKLKALKTVMDGLSGGQQNEFDMTTRMAEANEKLIQSMKDALPTFFSTTEAGRSQRDALSDAASAARDLALAHAETSGNMQAGAVELQKYADGLAAILAQAGLSKTQIQQLLEQMGLTPAQISTLFTLTEDPPGGIEDTNKKLDDTAAPRTATVTAQDANVPTTDDILNTLARTYRQADITSNPANVPGTDSRLGELARQYRPADITAQPTNTGPTDSVLNSVARQRNSGVYQSPDTSAAESWLTWTSRSRNSSLYQAPNTSDAEWWLNYTARNRTSTVTVYTTSGNVYAGPTGFGIAEGGIVHAYAQGGFENHVAQIGRMGASRVWNEPETGGEAYIPLAQAKRARSLAIWEETGRMLGAKGGGSGPAINVNAPISFTVSGASDPEVTGQVVAGHVEAGINAALSRVLTEIRTR